MQETNTFNVVTKTLITNTMMLPRLVQLRIEYNYLHPKNRLCNKELINQSTLRKKQLNQQNWRSLSFEQILCQLNKLRVDATTRCVNTVADQIAIVESIKNSSQHCIICSIDWTFARANLVPPSRLSLTMPLFSQCKACHSPYF